MRKLFAGILSLVFIFGFSVYAAYSQLTLTLADIHSPAFHARNIKIHFVDQQASQLEIHIGEVAVQDNLWRNVNLSCDQFQVDRNHVECASGQLNIPNLVSLPIAFQFDTLQKKLQLNIKPTSDEDWQFSIHWDEDNWQALLNITDGQAAHFARWMLDNGETPVPSHGTINAAVKLEGNLDGLTHFVVDLSVNRLSFSDQIGLHAGENLELILKANADYIAENKRWRWHTEMDWLQGEVFWQPVYFVGHGHRLHLNGMLSDKDIRLHDGKLSLVGIGEFEFAGL
ncbi:MAG: hypothetical protein OEX11_03315, partial [Nitrosomonas sp.]|nr:hypothetical protein [Nitrosomonas sp.]